jgi:glycosyltransferase involved in cell wall biosynthesis
MAVGTPVIAFPNGSVPEVIDHEVTGFIVQSVEEAARVIHRVVNLDRSLIRRTFEERFSVERMTDEYEAVYRSLLQGAEVAAYSNRSLRHTAEPVGPTATRSFA